MLEALHAPAPNPALASKLQTYGRFVGSWTVDIDWHPPGGAPARHAEGEWTSPGCSTAARSRRLDLPDAPAARAARAVHFYGSTMRWYDPQIDAWHITYFEPTRPFACASSARGRPDIVQIARIPTACSAAGDS